MPLFIGIKFQVKSTASDTPASNSASNAAKVIKYFFYPAKCKLINLHGFLFYIKIGRPGEVCCLKQPPDIRLCPKSSSGEMILSNQRHQFHLIICRNMNLYCFLFQPRPSHQQPACPKTAQKRRSGEEVWAIYEKQSNVWWNTRLSWDSSVEIFANLNASGNLICSTATNVNLPSKEIC